MMQTLRKYMKHILWVVAVAFIATIIFSWGMGGFKTKQSQAEQGIIGIINGQKIQYQQFSALVNQEVEATRQRENTTEINEYTINTIRDRVWQTIVQEVLFSQEVKRLNIQATPDEIVFMLRNSPPDFLRSNEQFQTDGQFDPAKYQQALSDPRNYDAWIPVENYIRTSLPLQKLQQRILATVRITDAEALEAYRLENERVNAKYVFFDPNDLSDEGIEITEDDIRTYYRENRETYEEPEKRRIRYVLFEAKPTQEDSAQVRYDAEDILIQLRDRADFGELAQEYSDDAGTSVKGGDLGFFGRGAMVAPFEEAVFSARPGEILGPIETQFGLHIIEVLEFRTEDGEQQAHARHILLNYKTSPETSDRLFERAQFFYDDVMASKGKRFDEVAAAENLEVIETPLFQEGRFIPGLGFASRPNHQAFLQKIGWVSEPMGVQENIIVYKLTDIQKKRYKPLEEVRESIEPILLREKKKEKAGETCDAFHRKLSTTRSLETAAMDDSLEIQETGFFSLQTFVTGVGRDAPFAGTAFRLDPGEVSEPVEGSRGYYIIQTIERTGVNENDFEAVKETQKQNLLQRKQQAAYSAWFAGVRDGADIEDFRDLYF